MISEAHSAAGRRNAAIARAVLAARGTTLTPQRQAAVAEVLAKGRQACRVCQREQPLTEFRPYARNATGREYRCRSCERVRGRAAIARVRAQAALTASLAARMASDVQFRTVVTALSWRLRASPADAATVAALLPDSTRDPVEVAVWLTDAELAALARQARVKPGTDPARTAQQHTPVTAAAPLPAPPACSTGGCGRPAVADGLCGACYRRWYGATFPDRMAEHPAAVYQPRKALSPEQRERVEYLPA